MRTIGRLMFGALAEPRFYSLAAIIILIVASVGLSQDRFTVTYGDGIKRVITRQDDPRTYWGTESAMVLVGAVLLMAGIHFERRRAR